MGDLLIRKSAVISADGLYRYKLVREWGGFPLLPFVIFGEHSGDPPCTHLVIKQMFCQNLVSSSLTNIRDQFAQLSNRHPSIF